jgi:hypothetical protein
VFFSQPRGRTTCFDGVGHDVEWVGTANRRDWYLVTRAAIGERCFDSGAEDQSP